MTVHPRPVETHRPPLVAPGYRLLAWVAIAAVIALIGIITLVVLTVIGPPAQSVPIEQLQQLRLSLGGGGFI